MRRNNTIVVKIGSAVLSDGAGGLDRKAFDSIVEDVSGLMSEEGRRVVIVTSGAIITGMGLLGLDARPSAMQKKQALAAIGQVRLMALYSELFAAKGIRVAQILLTHEDVSHRQGFLNIRRTMTELLDMGVLPIINENDSVSTQEIRFGENDMLAVVVANIMEAGSVVFLSSAPGLMDLKDGSRLIPRVERVDGGVFALVGSGSSEGTGGMGSKLMAMERLTAAGKTCYLGCGKEKGIIRAFLKGEARGTVFAAGKERPSSRRQWMSHHLRPHGKLFVDKGAHQALVRGKASLLAPGISSMEGHFKAGQLVSILFGGEEFARGMSRLDSSVLDRIKGLSKDESSKALSSLGADPRGLVVHRNDIVLLKKDGPEEDPS